MTIAVFWIEKKPSEMFPGWSEPRARVLDDDKLVEALALTTELRTNPMCSHITMVIDHAEAVGTSDAGGIVEDGKLPDGSDYTWRKRR